MYEWMDGCMDAWMDGWMHACMYVCKNKNVYIIIITIIIISYTCDYMYVIMCVCAIFEDVSSLRWAKHQGYKYLTRVASGDEFLAWHLSDNLKMVYTCKIL